MPSPFPGMDPYLEQHWRDIHSRLIVYAVDQLQERLPRDLLARVEEGVSVDYSGEERSRTVYPDVRVVHDGPFGGGNGGTAVATAVETATLAEVIVVALDEPPARHVEIIDLSSGNRVVTVVEFLSPSNKLPGCGYEEYRRKQTEYLAAGVNLVEIDLLRQGAFTLAVPPSKLPQRCRAPYLACVRPSAKPQEAIVYRLPLRAKLATIHVPLRPADPDADLELQPLIDQCYSRGRYDRIDYSQEPDPPFPPDDAAWAAELLRAAGRR